MGMEIERKFTVKQLPEELDRYRYHIIEQAYLTDDPVIRVRREDESYYMTYKGVGGDNTSLAHEEYNLKLTKEAYDFLASKTEGTVNGRVVSKFDEVKCLPDSIEELKAQYNCIGKPHNLSPKYWIGVDAKTAPDDLLQELTKHSYEIVKAKYNKYE